MNKMPLRISLIIFIFSAVCATAQTTKLGYYISKTNDTIPAEFKIRKGVFGQVTNNFNQEIEIIDSVNGGKRCTPDDINGYGFLYNNQKYLYFSKPTKNGNLKFLTPIFIGAKASLYQYGFQSSGGGTLASQQVFYTFEKANGEYLFLRNILNKKFKSELSNFLKEYSGMQELIDSKLQYWLDLKKDLYEIMQVANQK